MMKNKKAQEGMIGFIIVATISVLLLANFLVPQVKTTTELDNGADALVYIDDNLTNQTFTLTNNNLMTLSIPGIILSTNYTQDLLEGSVIFLNNTNIPDGTYNATYTYKSSSYVDNPGQRALMGVIILAGIIGLIYFMFRGFGL